MHCQQIICNSRFLLAGRVVKVGSDVGAIKLGDQVAVAY
jgi:NADPH:quinone reductase-like Zn-dependent oxidoreductase